MGERKTGFWATVRAVLWSLLGVRKRSGYLDDADSLDPKAVILAGVLAGVIFVLVLIGLIRFVIMP